MGLAMLAKGLVGIMLVLAILGIYFLIIGQLKTFQWRYLPLGFLAFLIVAAIWYLPVTLVNGWSFINEFFVEHHFHRYLTNRYSHPQPFYFYLLISLIGVIPWTFFLVPAVARIRHLRPRNDNRDALVTMAWIWLVVPVAFFSFSVSKLPGYILPVFPALAIIIGTEVEKFLSSERTLLHKIAAWLTALLLISLGAAFIIFAEREGIVPSGWKVAFLWLPAILASVALVLLIASRHKAFVSLTASVIAGAVIIIVALGFPVLGERLSLKRLSLQAAAALRPDEKSTFFVMKEFAPLFYTEGRVMCGVGGNHVLNAMSEAQLVEAMQGEESLVVFTTTDWIRNLERSRVLAVEHIGQQGRAYAVRVTFKEPAISSK
jgi:4-amino-4-deoxy-L-arabinose transferase-like glycosyltransferase